LLASGRKLRFQDMAPHVNKSITDRPERPSGDEAPDANRSTAYLDLLKPSKQPQGYGRADGRLAVLPRPLIIESDRRRR
jgi:hypothetical protein